MSQTSYLAYEIASITESIDSIECYLKPRINIWSYFGSKPCFYEAFSKLSGCDRLATAEFIKSRLEARLQILTKEFKELI